MIGSDKTCFYIRVSLTFLFSFTRRIGTFRITGFRRNIIMDIGKFRSDSSEMVEWTINRKFLDIFSVIIIINIFIITLFIIGSYFIYIFNNGLWLIE